MFEKYTASFVYWIFIETAINKFECRQIHSSRSAVHTAETGKRSENVLTAIHHLKNIIKFICMYTNGSSRGNWVLKKEKLTNVCSFRKSSYICFLNQLILRPDYSHKLFSDERCQYIFLLMALATNASH